MDSEERWTYFKTVTSETAKELIGYKKRQHTPWMSERGRILSERQRRVQIDDETNSERRAGLREERRIAMRDYIAA